MSERRPVLSLDIGGTKLAVAVVTDDGVCHGLLVEPTHRDDGPDPVLARLFDMGTRAIDAAGLGPIAGVGISCGGPLRRRDGILTGPLHLPGWAGIPIVSIAEKRFGTPAALGNDATAAAQHLTGEIIGHYVRDRRPLGAVTLSTDPSALTCIANDFDFSDVFARQVEALVRPGDVVAAFTTTGGSPNVVSGLQRARDGGATTVLFGGGDGGPAREFAHHALLVPSTSTPRIQEAHTFLLHAISEMVDAWAAGEEETP